eukprot:scaffold410_cov81-Skeletonema_marinoi.AAC.2
MALIVVKCLQRSVLSRDGSHQQSTHHVIRCILQSVFASPLGEAAFIIGCAGSQPIMFIAALGEVSCWMRSCQLSLMMMH